MSCISIFYVMKLSIEALNNLTNVNVAFFTQHVYDQGVIYDLCNAVILFLHHFHKSI